MASPLLITMPRAKGTQGLLGGWVEAPFSLLPGEEDQRGLGFGVLDLTLQQALCFGLVILPRRAQDVQIPSWSGLGYFSGLQDLAAWNLHSISLGAARSRQSLDHVPEKYTGLSLGFKATDGPHS